MRIVFLCLFGFFILPYHSQAQTLEKQWQKIVDSAYAENPESIGLIYHIEIPNRNISWSYAIGYSDNLKTEKLNPNQPVLIASNTKTYVSAAILKLIEADKFNLNDGIENLVSPKTKELLESDGYDLTKISIRHLLSHTSGISDYVDKEYFNFLLKTPKRRWTRDEQIKRTVNSFDKKAEAGDEYSYADINFVLLTEIIEIHWGKKFHIAIAEILDFKKLGLNSTWFKTLDKDPKQMEKIAHQYSTKKGLDSYDLDPSWDLYGGGGIASTAKEMALFFDALFSGKIIKDQSLLKEISSFQNIVKDSKYCLGLMRINFNGETMFYHGGFWGTDVMYSPNYKASFSAVCLEKDQREINAHLNKRFLQVLKSN